MRLLVKNARNRASKAGLPFAITEKDIIIPSFCPVFGIPLTFRHGHGRANDGSPSLDRIIPDRGYVPGNILVISNRANRIKNNSTAAELRKLADFYERLSQCEPS